MYIDEEKLLDEIHEVIGYDILDNENVDMLYVDICAIFERKRKCSKCNGTGLIHEIRQAAYINNYEDYTESRPCPTCWS